MFLFSVHVLVQFRTAFVSFRHICSVLNVLFIRFVLCVSFCLFVANKFDRFDFIFAGTRQQQRPASYIAIRGRRLDTDLLASV